MAKTAYQLFYSYAGQHTSVGNYWNDPHKQLLYYQYSDFLPYVNNEIVSNNSSRFRDGLLKLENMILIGGPDDGVITPWQSSHFGYYNSDNEVEPMRHRDIYQNDTIGLRALEKQNRLHIITIPNVHHMEWHMNLKVIRETILPFLD